jgi:RNA 2',3'-cyclic 3'-phosphodiesterase
MAAVEKKRLFVAIYPSREVVEHLRQGIHSIAKQIAPGAIRWTVHEQIHLTLNFLGSIETSRIAEFDAALQSVSCQCAGHPLRVAGVGCFPSVERPRIIWAGLKGVLEPLQRLKQLLDRALEKAGYVPETRTFHPHLTIGRVEALNTHQRQCLKRAICSFEQTDFGQWQTQGLDLVQSVLSTKGATYCLVRTFPLTGA